MSGQQGFPNSSTRTGPEDTDAYILPSKRETRTLLDTFFVTTGLQFPYIHPPSFLQTYTDLIEQRRPVRRTWLALLNEVLAITVLLDTEGGVDCRTRQQRAQVFHGRALTLGGGLTSTHASLETGIGTLSATVNFLLINPSTIPSDGKPISPGDAYFESNLGNARACCKSGITTRTAFESNFEALFRPGPGDRQANVVRMRHA